MNINITIGVTPQLEQALQGISALFSNVNSGVVQQPQLQPPAQPMQQTQAVQATAVPEQAPVATPAAVPTAPVQQPQPPAQVQPAIQPQTVPTAAQTYTVDQLAKAATQLMDAGKREELVKLLTVFGVQALMDLPQEHYGAFATKLRELGAKI